MEWILVLIQVLMLGGFLLWEGYSRQKGKNLAVKEDARVIAYEQKKGEILATKQDLDKITDAVESIKDSYNKSLEKHKIELQKDFESYKYRVRLCNSIDEQLLGLIYDALNKYHAKGIDYPESNDKDLISASCKISHFLSSYYSRYGHIKQFDELNDITAKIFETAQLSCAPEMLPEHKEKLICCLNASIAIFLPRFT